MFLSTIFKTVCGLKTSTKIFHNSFNLSFEITMLTNLLLLLTFLAVTFAEKSTPALNWKTVAIDASGKYHVAAPAFNNDLKQGYPIYLSDDYGANWRQSKSPTLDWRNVYSDSTGQLLIGYAVYNSLSSSSYPPLYISKDRGNTWTTGAATNSYSLTFSNDITSTNSTLWTVMNSNLYYSNDVAKTWVQSTKIINPYGYVATIDHASLDSTGTNRYVTCDGGFCASHNGGSTYTGVYNQPEPLHSVETDSTGQYVFTLSSGYLKYSTDHGSTFVVLKDYSVAGSPYVQTTILKITSDHKYVYLIEKTSSTTSTATIYNLVRLTVSSKSSTTLLSTTNWTDFAISGTGTSIIVSTTSNLYTTNNSGSSWTTHTISV